jgi:hypothetical protein
MRDKRVILLFVMIAVMILGYFYSQRDKIRTQPDQVQSEVIKTDKAKAESRRRQDSLARLDIEKQKQLAAQQLIIDSISKENEKLKNKPKPEHLRTATVAELDSFWTNYKAFK